MRAKPFSLTDPVGCLAAFALWDQRLEPRNLT
jgi:hypothetical protein